MREPPKFLIGVLATGEQRWAGIDVNAHHLEGRVSDRRFAAYWAPYRSEEEARQALIAVGATNIEAEAGRKRRVAIQTSGKKRQL